MRSVRVRDALRGGFAGHRWSRVRYDCRGQNQLLPLRVHGTPSRPDPAPHCYDFGRWRGIEAIQYDDSRVTHKHSRRLELQSERGAEGVHTWCLNQERPNRRGVEGVQILCYTRVARVKHAANNIQPRGAGAGQSNHPHFARCAPGFVSTCSFSPPLTSLSSYGWNPRTTSFFTCLRCSLE